MKYISGRIVKMEPTVSSETSAIITHTPGNYPKRNKLHLEHGESLKTRKLYLIKPSLHNSIDSYSTAGYINNMFRPCLAIIRLTNVSIN